MMKYSSMLYWQVTGVLFSFVPAFCHFKIHGVSISSPKDFKDLACHALHPVMECPISSAHCCSSAPCTVDALHCVILVDA